MKSLTDLLLYEAMIYEFERLLAFRLIGREASA